MDNKEDAEPSRILKQLFLGGKAHARDGELLRRLGITHVVNCSPSRSVDKKFGIPNYFKKEGKISYLRIPIFDNKGEDITPWLEEVHKFISHARHYGNILVHCLRGVSRSASFVIGYLMKESDMTVEEALSHVMIYRSVVQPNEAFMTQLRKYEEKLLSEKASTNSANIEDVKPISVPYGAEKHPLETAVSVSSDIGPAIKISVCDNKDIKKEIDATTMKHEDDVEVSVQKKKRKYEHECHNSSDIDTRNR